MREITVSFWTYSWNVCKHVIRLRAILWRDSVKYRLCLRLLEQLTYPPMTRDCSPIEDVLSQQYADEELTLIFSAIQSLQPASRVYQGANPEIKQAYKFTIEANQKSKTRANFPTPASLKSGSNFLQNLLTL